MAALTLFGWVVLVAIGLWMLVGGLFAAWVTHAFGGRPSLFCLVPIIAGSGALVLAEHIAPFSILWKSVR
jgi:hypothetical protein